MGGCGKAEPPASEASSAQAAAFIQGINQDYRPYISYLNSAKWIHHTYLTRDTQMVAARANEDWLAYLTRKLDESKRFNDVPMDKDTARSMLLLKLLTNSPAPHDAEQRRELIRALAQMSTDFKTSRWCPTPGGECLSLDQAEKIIRDPQRSPEQRAAVWAGWHDTTKPLKANYQTFVTLANQGARELGFADLGQMWRSGYDMSPTQFERTVEKLWRQMQPLYEALHCEVRAQLNRHYGDSVVPKDGLIPAHLLGDMWAQDWSSLYPLLEPYQGVGSLDVDSALKARREREHHKLLAEFKGTPTAHDLAELSHQADLQYAIGVTRLAEDFYTSIGFPSLPSSFYERSMFVRPRDRVANCSGTAWSLDMREDVRIKMCIEPTEAALIKVHHLLGHSYYQLAYNTLPPIFQDGANDGFDEAIGDTITLSLTPAYLQKIGLISDWTPDPRALVNAQMKLALDKIAFLPWGKLVDQWRWKVFSGEITPAQYNTAWWQLRERYQGVSPPLARSPDDFDPGSKFNIPGNTMYVRFLLAYVLQFQFQKALCDAAGFEGPLHECNIYGSKEAGARLMAMLKVGASQPWQDTLEMLTGTREMDASALIEYFQPLMDYLKQQNEGRTCGWRTSGD